MSLIKVASSFLLIALATAHPVRRAVTPKVSGTPEVLGVASSSTWTRDSCTSTRVRDRELWTCRDSMSSGAFISSSASWTNFSSDGTPAVVNGVLAQYGEDGTSNAYFAVQNDECGGNSGGVCANGNRYALWPNTRPMPIDVGTDGAMSLYTFISNSYITSDFATITENPAGSLYRSDYTSDLGANELPPVTLVSESFWSQGSILYGNYGFVVKDDTAYLYGLLNGTSGVALAKVATGSVEDKSAYSYWTGSSWSSTAPDIMDTGAAVSNAGTTGQGTFYWSAYFDSYVWIGSPWYGDCATFLISTAPAPEGPWTEATTFYEGEPGTASGLVAYSQQAHPGLSKDYGSGDDIYLTYTKVDSSYSTPLIHVIWE